MQKQKSGHMLCFFCTGLVGHQTSDCQKVPDVGIIGQAAQHLAVDPAWDVVHLK